MKSSKDLNECGQSFGSVGREWRRLKRFVWDRGKVERGFKGCFLNAGRAGTFALGCFCFGWGYIVACNI